MSEHKLPKPDRIITNLVKLIKDFELAGDTGNSNVPCNGCTKCCRAKGLFAELTEEEAKTYRHMTQNGMLVLEKREDHSCVYLIDDKCSIYETRPGVCREFDCRWWGVTRFVPCSDPDTVAIAQQWTVKPKTDADLAIMMAIQLANRIGIDAQNQGRGTHLNYMRDWRKYLPLAEATIRKKRRENT